MGDSNMIEVSEPGTIEDFQKESLRRWRLDGVEGLDIDNLSREQALALHQCALYLEHVHREETGDEQIPGHVMCAGMKFILEDPSRHQSAAKWVEEMTTVEPWEGKMDPNRIRDELYCSVADAMRVAQ